MAFKVLAGPYLNHLARCAVPPVMDPVAVAAFPVGHLYDYRAALPCIFSTNAVDSTITADLNMLGGGSAETAGDEAYWTVLGTGTFVVDSGDNFDGASAFKASPITTSMLVVQDVIVRAGESLHFQGAVRGADASILIRNRQTGNFLVDDGTWVPPVAAGGNVASGTVLVGSTGAWENIDLTFAVESLAICKRDTVTLRVYLWVNSGTAYFDALYLWPLTSWASIHGHNISPFVTPKIQSSDDNAAWTTRATMTIRPDTFHSPLGSLMDHRYWRLLLEHYPDPAPLTYLGELVLGQLEDLIHNPVYGGQLTWNDRQTRSETAQGEEWVFLHNARPQRGLMLTYGFRKDDEYEQFRDVLFRGSRGGANVIVIAPVEMDSGVVILGRIRESATVAKSSPYRRAGELEVIESPLPNLPDHTHAFDLPIDEGGGGA